MNLKKLALLSLLAVALFVPQQSHALNWKQWAAIGTAFTFASVIGYQIYESISAQNEPEEIYIKRIFPMAQYAGSEHEAINKQYNLKTTDDKINFTDVFCLCYTENNESFKIPLKILIEGCTIWEKEDTPKTIKVGSHLINFESCKFSKSELKQYFNELSQLGKNCLVQDQEELKKRGVSVSEEFVLNQEKIFLLNN